MAFVRTAVNTTGNTTLNSSTLTVASNTGMFVGMCIYGTGIQADTVITAIAGTTVTMSRNATATTTGVTITGQYITQSGTDTDPSGLAAMTGVTTIVEGTGSRLIARYNLGTNQLRITGTLNHNPDQYSIVSNVQLGIIFEGVAYNYGVEKVVNGRYSYSKACGLEFTYSGALASQFPFQIRSGNFVWRGGIIRIGGALSLSGGSFNQKGDTSVMYNNNSGTPIQIRTILAPANMIYEKIKLAGDNTVYFWTTQTYGTISASLENGAVQTPSGFSPTQTYTDFVFANNQAPADFYINQLSSASSTLSIVKNPDSIPRVAQLNNGAYGVVETRESLAFNVNDSNNHPANDVVIYLKDSNNGARTDENQLIYTNDFEYIAYGNENLNIGDVLVNVQMKNPSSPNTVKHDYRGNFGATSVDFNVYLGGYDYNPAVTRQKLLGNGGKNVDWTIFPDINPTLSRANALTKLASSFTIEPITKTITITSDSGLEDLYDAPKAYKYNGSKANMLIPAIDKLLVEANGEILTMANNWNLTIGAGVSLKKSKKFKQLKLTGSGLLSFAPATETIPQGTVDFPFSDALGSRVLVFNLDPENFGVTWHLRYRKKAVGSTPASPWVNVSGTGNSTTILAEIATYDVMVRVPGYDWKTTEIDTNETLSLDVNLAYHVSANNTPQYTMSFDEDLESLINFDYATNSVSIANTTGAIINPGFAEFYRATQRIQHIPALVWIWESPVTANSTSQKILIPTGNAISFFLTENSNASVKATCPVIHQATGQSADDRVKGNASGYSIILGSPATAESAGLQSAIVSDLMEKLGGAGYAVGTDSLKKIKDQLDLVKTKVDALENYNDVTLSGKVDAVKAVVDALENYNDTPTQDKLNLIKLAVDALENYNDTTLIAKVDAIKSVVDSIKTTVEDKTGYALTTSQIELIATTVESHLLDEGDSKKLIEAIVGAIGNANIDETALVAAIRADLERAGGKIDTIPTNPVLASDSRLNHLDADVSSRSTLTVQDIPEGLTVAEIEASTVLAKENTSQAIKAKVDTLVNTDVSGLPTLSEIEASTILAKEASVQELAQAQQGTTPASIKEELRPLLAVINNGVKNASKIKTHKQNLPE